MQRAHSLLRICTYEAAMHARSRWTMRAFASGLASENPFSEPSVRQEAIARWGLDYRGPSALVYPQGRPDIAALAKETSGARIASGLFPQRKPKKDRGAATEMADQAKDKDATFTRRKLDKDAPVWLKHRQTIREKHGGEFWEPHKRVPRQTMEQIRYLRKQFPEDWTTPKLAGHFKISVESVTRILRSKFTPSDERSREQDDKRQALKKVRVAASVEKTKTKRYLDWLRHEVATPSAITTQVKKPRSRAHIKLGAPKRE
ncbi:Required for respiratory growth protein 9 mitochondrial [Actinomortierella ambigua]|nr:Required for respiratory growth protein 9 mitochondrial [Actinomortierella ambigua]